MHSEHFITEASVTMTIEQPDENGNRTSSGTDSRTGTADIMTGGISALTDIEDQLIWAYLLVLWVVSIYANGVIVLFLAKSKQRLRALDHLMENIALSNGLLAFLTFPLMIFSLMRHEWMFGMEGCTAYSFVTTLCGLVSIWTLVGVAGLLYCRITASATRISQCYWSKKGEPDFEQSRYVRYVIVFLIFDYALCFVLCVLPLFGVGKYGYGKHGTSCTVDWSEPTITSSIYLFFLFTLGLGVPLILIVGFYMGINRCLTVFSKEYAGGKNAQRWMSVHRKTVKMAVSVGISLVVCWTPYTLIALWQSYGDPTLLPVRIEAIAALLAKSSTAVTPITHLWFVKKYNVFFKQVFCCLRMPGTTGLESSNASTLSLPSSSQERQPIVGTDSTTKPGSYFSTENIGGRDGNDEKIRTYPSRTKFFALNKAIDGKITPV